MGGIMQILNNIRDHLPKLTRRCPICNSLARAENHGLYFSRDINNTAYYSMAIYLSCHDYIKGGLVPLYSNQLSNSAILRIFSAWNVR